MAFVDEFGSRGHAPALLFPGGQVVSYAELDRRTADLCRTFGAGRKLVAVEARPSEHAIVAYLAALRGRHPVALLPPDDGASLDEFTADFAPDIVVASSDGRWRCTEASRLLRRTVHPDLALLLGTSGSTGKRRFVRLSAQALEANAGSIASFLALEQSDRAALILPFHYSYGLSVLNSHLAIGASIHVAPHGAAHPGFLDEVRQAGCTNIAGVPYSYEFMERAAIRAEVLPDLRFMTVAGGRMPPDLVDRWRRRLTNRGKQLFLMYGQTEATARIAYVPPESLAGNTDSIGIAIPGGSLRLVDERGMPVETAGQAGELVYRGPNVMMGYAESSRDLARGHEIDELKTGDIAERDAQGFFRIIGRRKRFSKIAGLRVNHAAIEHALNAEGISAAVIGDDRRLLAAVASGRSPEHARSIMAAASGLSPLQVEAFAVEHLPRLASGKVDYAALTVHLETHRADPESGILDAFRRAFYPTDVRARDSFESLEGDSLRYVQLSLVLERQLGRAPDGWEKQPIGQLERLPRSDETRQAVDIELPMRAVAILLVVIHHATLWPIPAGAAVLMMLVGRGIARFHSAALFAGDPIRLLKSLAINLAIYLPVAVGFSLARGEVLWPSFLLVGNLELTDPSQKLPYLYWFVEAYAQIVLLWAAMFAFGPVRRLACRSPFVFGIGLLGAAITAKLAVPLVWNVGQPQIFTVPDVLYLAVLGWCIHFAPTVAARLGLLGIAVLILPCFAYLGGNWIGSWVKFTLVFAAVAALLYAPRVQLPRWAMRAALPISAAGYHIYLFHRILPELLLPQPDQMYFHLLPVTLAIVVGILCGLAVHAVQGKVIAWLADRRFGLGEKQRLRQTIETPAL